MTNDLRDIAYSKEERIKKLEEQLSRVAKHVIKLEQENEELVERTSRLEEKLDELKQESSDSSQEEETVRLTSLIETEDEETTQEEQQEERRQESEEETVQEKESEGEETVQEEQEPEYKTVALDGVATRAQISTLFKENLKESNEPLGIKELAEKSFSDVEEVKTQTREYNYTASVLRELYKNGEIERTQKRPALYNLEAGQSHDSELSNLGRRSAVVRALDELEEKEAISPGELSTDEKITRALQALEELDHPLSRKELIQFIFNKREEKADSGFRSGGDYRNAARYSLDKMRAEGLAENVTLENADGKKTFLEITDEGREWLSSKQHFYSSLETDSQKGWEELKEDVNIPDRDVEILENAFENLFIDRQLDEVTYYDFESEYAGNLSPIKMYQKLFSNPELLKRIGRRVSNMELKWERSGREDNSGVRSWVITIG